MTYPKTIPQLTAVGNTFLLFAFACFLHTVTHTHGFVHNARSIVSISLAFLSMWLGAVIEVLSSGENVMGAGRGIVGATLDALLGWLVVAVFKRIFYL